MNRCAHFDREYVGTPPNMREKKHHCKEPGVWVWRGDWWCDPHARLRWEWELMDLWTPRDRTNGRDPDHRVPPWVPSTLRSLADRLDARVLLPVAPPLFEEMTR